jgi:hypothetical protein
MDASSEDRWEWLALATALRTAAAMCLLAAVSWTPAYWPHAAPRNASSTATSA